VRYAAANAPYYCSQHFKNWYYFYALETAVKTISHSLDRAIAIIKKVTVEIAREQNSSFIP
jgi:hypothetical protein